MDIALRYTGGGHGGAIPSIPARDLTDEEVETYGGMARLIATGLYEPVHGPTDDAPSADDVAPLPERPRRSSRKGDK